MDQRLVWRRSTLLEAMLLLLLLLLQQQLLLQLLLLRQVLTATPRFYICDHSSAKGRTAQVRYGEVLEIAMVKSQTTFGAGA